jgi:stress-induced morphogen
MKPQEIISKIRESLPDALVELEDLTGTEDHWKATVVSAEFAGKSMIQRHRMVFDALRDEMKGPIHALTLVTRPPSD